MLTVDPRVGSRPGGVHDLVQSLRSRGLASQHQELPYGDVAWVGSGPGGRPVSCGLEIKTVSDALACIQSGRFAGRQLEGLQDAYEVSYLIIVGPYRAGQDGELLIPHSGGWIQAPHGPKGGWTYSAFRHWVTTQRFKGGLIVDRVWNKDELIAYIHSEYSWWALGTDHHKAHLEFDNSFIDKVAFVAPSIARKMIAQLPGVGWDKSKAIELHFTDMKALVTAGEKEWREIQGVGKTLSKRIVDELAKPFRK